MYLGIAGGLWHLDISRSAETEILSLTRGKGSLKGCFHIFEEMSKDLPLQRSWWASSSLLGTPTSALPCMLPSPRPQQLWAASSEFLTNSATLTITTFLCPPSSSSSSQSHPSFSLPLLPSPFGYINDTVSPGDYLSLRHSI